MLRACPQCGCRDVKKQKGNLYQCKGCQAYWEVKESSPGTIHLVERKDAPESISLEKQEPKKTKPIFSFTPLPI